MLRRGGPHSPHPYQVEKRGRGAPPSHRLPSTFPRTPFQSSVYALILSHRISAFRSVFISHSVFPRVNVFVLRVNVCCECVFSIYHHIYTLLATRYLCVYRSDFFVFIIFFYPCMLCLLCFVLFYFDLIFNCVYFVGSSARVCAFCLRFCPLIFVFVQII